MLIQAMCNVMPFMVLMKIILFIFDIHLPKSELFCKVFNDNQRFIAIMKPKHFHQELNIGIKYHRFRRFVQINIIHIYHIDTREQMAGTFSKPLDK